MKRGPVGRAHAGTPHSRTAARRGRVASRSPSTNTWLAQVQLRGAPTCVGTGRGDGLVELRRAACGGGRTGKPPELPVGSPPGRRRRRVDIDQGPSLRRGPAAALGDHGSAVGVPDEHDRPAKSSAGSPRRIRASVVRILDRNSQSRVRGRPARCRIRTSPAQLGRHPPKRHGPARPSRPLSPEPTLADPLGGGRRLPRSPARARRGKATIATCRPRARGTATPGEQKGTVHPAHFGPTARGGAPARASSHRRITIRVLRPLSWAAPGTPTPRLPAL